MANIVETDNWPGGVYQYADGDVLNGGPDSAEVLPLKQLAQRALYQRLRNVTDWDGGLAAAFGYPAGAVVRHAGVSWRAKIANDVEPGTDPAAWERWGWSESELDTRPGAQVWRNDDETTQSSAAAWKTFRTMTALRTGKATVSARCSLVTASSVAEYVQVQTLINGQEFGRSIHYSHPTAGSLCSTSHSEPHELVVGDLITFRLMSSLLSASCRVRCGIVYSS